jgi:hypothetical protein
MAETAQIIKTSVIKYRTQNALTPRQHSSISLARPTIGKLITVEMQLK